MIGAASQVSESVLIQWLFAQYFHGYQALKMLSPTLSGEREQLQALCLKLTKLATAERNPAPLLLFAHHDGALARLKNSCIWLGSRYSQFQDLRYLARLVVESCLCAIDTLQERPDEAMQIFPPALEKILELIGQLGKRLLEAALLFSGDENLLLFLIRNRRSFDRCFGKGALLNWLESCYQEGLGEVERILGSRYSARGFSHLLPVIAEKMEEVKR